MSEFSDIVYCCIFHYFVIMVITRSSTRANASQANATQANANFSLLGNADPSPAQGDVDPSPAHNDADPSPAHSDTDPSPAQDDANPSLVQANTSSVSKPEHLTNFEKGKIIFAYEQG